MTQVGTIFGVLASDRHETMQNSLFYAATGIPANSARKSKQFQNESRHRQITTKLQRRPAIAPNPP
jgi:hypothetical protein